MLRGAGHRVEKHQKKDQPVEVGGFDGHAAVLPERVVQLAQLITNERGTVSLFFTQACIE